MTLRITTAIVLSVWAAFAQAQTCTPSATRPAVTDVYAPLTTDFQATHVAPPMYAPGVFQIGAASDGVIGMYTHGNCLGNCDGDTGGDSLFRWRRATSGSWSDNYAGITPHATGTTFTSLGESIPGGADPHFRETLNDPDLACQAPIQNASGIFGTPELAVIDNKLFMAYLKGNGDGYTGELWWAVSYDWGAVWYVYGALVYAPQHRGHNAQAALSCNEGWTETAMLVTTDAQGQKWFNLYGMYDQPDSEYYGRSSIHFKVKYDANNWYGLSSTSRQLYYNGGFINHNGQIYWSHDQVGGLDPGKVDAPWDDYNGRSIISASSATTGGGYHYMLADGVKLLRSTDGVSWTYIDQLDMTKVNCAYGTDYRAAHNAIFYGTLGTSSGTKITGFWGFFSFEDPQLGSQGAYHGTRILPVKLNIP